MDASSHDSDISADLLAEVIESTPDYIGITTADCKYLYFNDAFRRLLPARSTGRAPATFRITDFHPPKVGQMLIEEAIPEAVKHGQWEGRTELLDAHGNAFPVTHIIVAHMNLGGTLVRLSTIMRDIRPILRIQNEPHVDLTTVQTLKDELERLNQVMIDRESRIAELKQENEELRRKLGVRET
jgi:PAS domain-containing protein